MKTLRSIAGKRIVFTGTAWRRRRELEVLVRHRGGTPQTGVTAVTDVLVRGRCLVWSMGDFGLKESKAAELIRLGHAVTVVDDLEFRKLLEERRPAAASDRVAGQPIQWLERMTKARAVRVATVSGPLDRDQSASGRVEQGYLRQHLFGGAAEEKCAICGRTLPDYLLVAAHIKPRADCSRSERLAFDRVAFLLCQLGCDALYERGAVAVGSDGRVVVMQAGSGILGKLLRGLNGRKCPAWNDRTADAFRWHLERRFRA